MDSRCGGIARVATGLPFTPLISGDPLGLQSASVFSFPDRLYTAGCTGNPVTLSDKFNYLKRSCFAFPAGNTISTATTTAANGTVTTTRVYNPALGEYPAELDYRAWGYGYGYFHGEEHGDSEDSGYVPRGVQGGGFQRAEPPDVPGSSRQAAAVFNATGTPLSSQILSLTSVSERQIQFGLKLIF